MGDDRPVPVDLVEAASGRTSVDAPVECILHEGVIDCALPEKIIHRPVVEIPRLLVRWHISSVAGGRPRGPGP